MASIESPLVMASADVAVLRQSEGFQILQRYLADDTKQCFCSDHNGPSLATKQTWMLHRDIVHALIMPVVQLFNRATELAEAALCFPAPEDLELAFREDARSAFLWLQCFLSEEDDWCYTRGCPACVVLHTLSTESTIRMAITSALLSSSAGAQSSNNSEVTSSSTTPSLPSLSCFLPALERAISADPFWGSMFCSDLLSRSQTLETSIHSLIAQCESLEVLVTSGPTSPTLSPSAAQPGAHVMSHSAPSEKPGEAGAGIRLRKATIARRQQRLLKEERAMVMRMAWQCFSAVTMPAEERMKIRQAGRRGSSPRTRSLTCP